MASTSTLPKKYDVFLSFRGTDTRSNFITFLYKELISRNIRTFKDDKELESGQTISPELSRAIKESKFAVVVISPNYASSTWCLEELVKIMELEDKGSLTVIPIFYGVDPCDVRWQIGKVAAQFKKHEEREDNKTVLTWRKAFTGLANISGDCSLKWEDDSMMIDKVATRIWRSTDTTTVHGSDIVGIDEHMKAILKLLDLNSKKNVRLVGIWARGGNGRSALTKIVYQNICQHFQSHCFLGNLKRISQDHHMWHLQKEFLVRVQGECLTRSRFENQKVLLVADDVSKLDQLDALADVFNCFGPGSIVIVTTQDRQMLNSYGIKLVYEVERLRFQKVCELFRQLSSRKINISAVFGSGSFLRDDDSNIFDGIIKKISKMLFSATPTKLSVYEIELLRCNEVRQLYRSVAFKERDEPIEEDRRKIDISAAKLVDRITEIRSKVFSATPTNGNYLSGIDQHMNKLYPLLDLNSNQGVRVTGIWGRGSIGRSVLARHVYENISHNFESHCFLEDVRRVSRHCPRSHFQEELYSKMQGKGLSANISLKSLKTIKARLRNIKILLVANDVSNIEQLAALAEEFSCFGPGSRIVITTQDKSLLSSSGVKNVYEAQLFRNYAFRERDRPVGLEPMNLPGINCFSVLKYIVAFLCVALTFVCFD